MECSDLITSFNGLLKYYLEKAEEKAEEKEEEKEEEKVEEKAEEKEEEEWRGTSIIWVERNRVRLNYFHGSNKRYTSSVVLQMS